MKGYHKMQSPSSLNFTLCKQQQGTQKNIKTRINEQNVKIEISTADNDFSLISQRMFQVQMSRKAKLQLKKQEQQIKLHVHNKKRNARIQKNNEALKLLNPCDLNKQKEMINLRKHGLINSMNHAQIQSILPLYSHRAQLLSLRNKIF